MSSLPLIEALLLAAKTKGEGDTYILVRMKEKLLHHADAHVRVPQDRVCE